MVVFNKEKKEIVITIPATTPEEICYLRDSIMQLIRLADQCKDHQRNDHGDTIHTAVLLLESLMPSFEQNAKTYGE